MGYAQREVVVIYYWQYYWGLPVKRWSAILTKRSYGQTVEIKSVRRKGLSDAWRKGRSKR